MKVRTKKPNLATEIAERVGPAIRGRRRGCEFVDVPQAGMVIERGSTDDVSNDVTGAYVKVAPTLRSSERSTFDSNAIRTRLLAAGAVAVVVVPVVVPDSTEDVRRADKPGVAAKRPEQHLREWFDGVKGAEPALVKKALEESLSSVSEVGL